ncbi:ROK family protein [Amycolatopsis taiwanensis]|uniref:Sugar kinase n=1 Tax=Amycolatopsis taiwanensis TaxID=342230 RepID=A0A9W6VG39_9PSEU|nr:ROK family protein [Amycolatopsis taiwanensis]GLY70328.1 sugar kinase [Amycolatopsis taiwanensis]
MTGVFPPSMSTVVALDVGGTTMKGLIARPDGQLVTAGRWPTPREDGPDAVVEAVLNAADDLVASAGDRVDAVGLVVPGFVDEQRGVATYSENIRWRDVPLRRLVAERTGLPVAFGHDVRSCGLAERALGAAREARDALVLPIGTGISGAMFVAGRQVRNPYAGEIGHLPVCGDEPCACGATGCLEAIASGAAIARRYGRATGRRVRGAAQVVSALRQGDEVAARVWAEAIAALADALTIYIGLLAPELIVLGGGVSLAGSTLLEPLREQVRRRLSWQPEPRLALAELGEHGAGAGAALLARGLLTRDLDRPA